jgi:ABC-2 type transport system permease protein
VFVRLKRTARKYFHIAQMGFKTQTRYTGNLLGRAVVYAMLVYMFTRLWTYMYGQGIGGRMAGYSLNQMLWYLVMTELTWFSARPMSIRRDIADDIRSGRIAYTLNKPYGYIGYILSKYAGEAAVNYGMNIVIALAIGFVFVGPLTGFSAAALPFIMITILLSGLVSCYIYLVLALVSFWVEENAPFIWIYEKFMLILGIIFPVEIFPEWAQPLIRLSPIYPTVYAPAKMTVDFSVPAWISVTQSQLVWLALAAVLSAVVLKRGERRLHVNGG